MSRPPSPVTEYPIFVARTNADGNPIGGVEPPEVTVPLGTYSGRNFRAEGFGQGDLCDLSGSYIPFAVTKKERLATHDSRLSLEERYQSQQDFAARRKQAADRLVQERLLLPEDAPVFSSVPLPGTSDEGPDKPLSRDIPNAFRARAYAVQRGEAMQKKIQSLLGLVLVAWAFVAWIAIVRTNARVRPGAAPAQSQRDEAPVTVDADNIGGVVTQFERSGSRGLGHRRNHRFPDQVSEDCCDR